jgi:chitinase
MPFANAADSIKAWKAAGMPASKITLGVPAYGYLQQSRYTSLIQRSGRRHNSTLSARGVTVLNYDGQPNGGQLGFQDFIRQGALKLNGQGFYEGANGFERRWDECSSTVCVSPPTNKDKLTLSLGFGRKNPARL